MSGASGAPRACKRWTWAYYAFKQRLKGVVLGYNKQTIEVNEACTRKTYSWLGGL